jgi:hypothetical protein
MIDRFGFDPDDVDERDEHECAEAWLKAHTYEQAAERCFAEAVKAVASSGRWRGLIAMYYSEGASSREVWQALAGLRDVA